MIGDVPREAGAAREGSRLRLERDRFEVPEDFVREVEATGSDADAHVLEADVPFDLTDALYYRA